VSPCTRIGNAALSHNGVLRKSVWALLLALPVCLLASVHPASAQGVKPLITQAVDETKLTTLNGNTHPLALPKFDHGPAPSSLPMQRMLLVLSRSPEQETALETLLEQQQYKLSPNFHKWLTPDEFGQQFGLFDQDIGTITSWLASHGFQVAGVSRGRNVIEFSGTAAQVQEAFHTTIHSYIVNGAQHWANASDPQIPAALAPAVAGVDTLNNFFKKAMHFMAKAGVSSIPGTPQQPRKPLFTFGSSACGGTCFGVGPYDFATIYNVLPLWTAASPIDGTGESIALVGRSNITLTDVSDFRTFFGLPANPPQVILDGPDPGLVPGDETEADLDVEWAGAVAKGATIKLIVSESTESTDGVDLSAEYAVDNDVAPILSESFGSCEFFMGATENQFYKNLWQQAAAEGISVFVSSGDEGSAGCDFFQGITPQPALNGLQVNGIASTPYDVAVGGTDFNDFSNPLLYWNSFNNSTTQESAKGYIPETTWNDSCTNAIWATVGFSTNPETTCNDPRLTGNPGAVLTVGGSGGKSGCTNPTGSTVASCSGAYPKPSWQTAPGVPSDTVRDLPDVSLFASNGFVGNFYAICEADLSQFSMGPCGSSSIIGIGGTSASSPAFAGIMALINQKMGAPQGDPNYVLYKLAGKQSASSCNSSAGPASTCVFNDITSGTIAMPCAAGSLNCTTSTFGDLYGVLSGYSTATGYDLATGLGSVNAANLVNDWNTVTFVPSTTTLTLNGGKTVNVTHGTPISASVSVSPTSPMPTGDVSLIATQGTNAYGFDRLTLSGGTASGTTNMLPGGASYTVKAHYAGDGTYGGSDSLPVTVTVNPEASQTNLHVLTFDPTTGQVTSNNATTFPYGSVYLVRVDVTNSSGTNCFSSSSSSPAYACPTGSVSLTDNGNALGSGPFALNSQGYAEDQAFIQVPSGQLGGGSHNLSASYSGDSSYTGSSGADQITVSPAATTTVIALPLSSTPPQTVVIGTQLQVLTNTNSQSFGAAPGGSVVVLDGTSQVGSLPTTGYAGVVGLGAHLIGNGYVSVAAPSGPHTLTVKYSGDTNYASSTSSPVTVNAVYPTTTTLVANPTNVIFGQGTSVTLTAVVDTTNPASNAALKPTGAITFSGVTGTVTTTATPDSSGNWELQATTSFTPQQSLSISANYSGDSNYEGTNGNVFVNVTIPDFSISSGATALTVTAGQSGSTTITVTPLTSYTSTVNLSCASANIPGATCSISPSSVTLSNNTAATATLTISTTAPSSNTSAITIPARFHGSALPFSPGSWWMLSLCSILAALMLLLLPSRRRALRPMLALGCAGLLSFAIGCGGASGSGPPAVTTTTLSVPSTKVAQASGQMTLTARVSSSKTVTGTVNFASSNCFVNNSGVVTNGIAQLIVNTGFIPPGTCTFNAQYSGDQNNQPSQSGNLNIAVTGNNTQPITAQTSTLSHPLSVVVSIQ
jgi:hypothetical protein